MLSLQAKPTMYSSQESLNSIQHEKTEISGKSSEKCFTELSDEEDNSSIGSNNNVSSSDNSITNGSSVTASSPAGETIRRNNKKEEKPNGTKSLPPPQLEQQQQQQQQLLQQHVVGEPIIMTSDHVMSDHVMSDHVVPCHLLSPDSTMVDQNYNSYGYQNGQPTPVMHPPTHPPPPHQQHQQQILSQLQQQGLLQQQQQLMIQPMESMLPFDPSRRLYRQNSDIWVNNNDVSLRVKVYWWYSNGGHLMMIVKTT